MESKFWLCCCMLLTLSINPVVSVREILQDFMTTASHGNTFEPADATVLDKDGDNVKPVVEKLNNNILLRVNTMPGFADPDATKLKEDNYVFFPYVNNPTGNSMLRLQYTFTHVAPCPPYSLSPVQCKDSLTLTLVSTTRNEDVNNIDMTASALFTHTLLEGTDLVVNHHISIPASTTGFRLVVHDEGSSYLIKHLTINRYYCEYIHDPHAVAITCPNSPASDGTTPTVQCTCDSNSSPSNGNANIEEKCLYNQNTESADFTRAASSTGVYCKCDTGYVFTPATATTPVHCAVSATNPTTTPTTTTPTTTTPTTTIPATAASSQTTRKSPSTTKPSGQSPSGSSTTTCASPHTLIYNWTVLVISLVLVLCF